ncbi:MAG: IclR family transcriptional regulator [Armatimonadota bacterium]|nr:IclR family transcriptional regulator [Armatimonadota bacterium]MDR7544918.1 IclR family transcriptional regulator [Armatimonadota bacterium]MDR7611768.1 IclR family transcriptional regulator [Armatimonadota bacterium]
MARPNYQIRAVQRALHVLTSFTAAEPEMSLSRLAAKTRLHKATLVRMLRCLESLGFIRQTAVGTYQLGLKVFELGSVYYVTQLNVERLARPWMERLVDRWGLTANLAVLDDGQIVYIAIVEPKRALRVQFSVGSRFAAHCTSLGKALLSGLDDREVDRILARRGLPRMTEFTITDPTDLKRQLAAVRARGYAVDDQESIPNVRCVGVPLRDHRGRVVAALSLSGSILDLTDQMIRAVASDLLEASAAISRAMGEPIAPGRTVDQAPALEVGASGRAQSR